MKYRLTEEKNEISFKEYLKKRFILTDLALELGMSNTGLRKILDGKSRRTNRRNLDFLAKKTNLMLGFDSDGPYFQDRPIENDELANNDISRIIKDNILDNSKSLEERELNRKLVRLIEILPNAESKKQLLGFIENLHRITI